MESARPATVDDVPRLVELCVEALAEMRPGRGGELFTLRETRSEPLDQSFLDVLDSPDHTAWLGTIDGVGVGYGVARVEPLRDGSCLGVIEDLYVEAPAREVAVGEALITAMLAWFDRRGCRGVDAYALPGSRQTKNFFEANGFSARLLVLHRPATR